MKIISVAPTLVRRGGKVFQRNSFTKLPPSKPLKLPVVSSNLKIKTKI